MKLKNTLKKGAALWALALGMTFFGNKEAAAQTTPVPNDGNFIKMENITSPLQVPYNDKNSLINHKNKGGYIRFGLGSYDVLANDTPARDLRLEWRWNKPLFEKVQPWVGLQMTSDKAAYAIAGITREWKIANNLYLSPSFGIGLYHNGRGKNLGYPVEFRSQIELGYEFNNKSRIQVSFGHISNGILGKHNPGTEILSVYYQIPLGRKP